MRLALRRFVLFFATCSLSAAHAKDLPNFLFLLSDDQRPDTIRALGNSSIATPHLDELVGRGMSFSRASCSNPICVASRAEILTGTHGWENGITAQPGNRLNEDRVSWWASTLANAGYQTCYVGKWHTAGKVLDRGFLSTEGFFKGGGGKFWEPAEDWKGFPITGYRGWVFQDPLSGKLFPEKGIGLTADISSKFADAAIAALGNAAQSDKPFFLAVNFTAPHDPLLMPPGLEGAYQSQDLPLPENYLPLHPFDHGNFGGRDEALLAWPRSKNAVRDLLRLYYSVIEDMDLQIGRIFESLDALGLRDNTYIVFSSDHGMACGSHGLRGKQNMYEHTINVPLIVSGPGIQGGVRSEAQVYLRDLYPTSCELASVSVPEKVTGRSFASVLRGEKKDHYETIYGYFREYQRMIRRSDGWKLILYPHLDRYQMYNLKIDPYEKSDLIDQEEYGRVQRELQEQLESWRRRQGDPLLANE